MRTDLVEEAALDPAPELMVGHPGRMGLLSVERTELTCRECREAAIGGGHAGHPSRGVSHLEAASAHVGQAPICG